jgi:tetratricopeptide (TPR) repeat protein
MTDAPTPARRLPNAVPLLLLAVGLSYSSAIHTGFVFDDNLHVTNSPTIGDARAYLDGAGGRWLSRVTLLANHRLGGLNPLGYHLFNVGVHALGVLTLFALLRRVLALPRFGDRFAGRETSLAFAVALLWAVHPLNTQAVTYVIQRDESLMGLFFLLTFYCWTRGATDGPPRLWYPLAVLSYLACCHCKEVCVALPPVLWAFDRVILADRWRTVLRRRWLPHLAILAVWGYALRPVLGGAFAAEDVGIGFGLDITPYQYLMTESEVLLHYLRLVVWPVGQSGDTADWKVAESMTEVWPAFAAITAVFLAGVVLLVVRPAVGLLFVWFFVILGPTSSVMPIRDVAFEHRMYLSLIAVVAGLVFAADALIGRVSFRYAWGRPLVAGVLVTVAAVALGRLTQLRNTVYRTNDTFLENIFETRPGNVRAKAAVAEIRLRQGRYDEAHRLLDEITRAGASSLNYRLHLGHIAYLEGRFGRAADHFRQMAKDPWPFMPRYVYRFLIPCELADNRYSAAAESARIQVEKLPDSPAHRFTLAAAELAAGNPDAARAAAADALARDPKVADGPAATARAALFGRHRVPAAQMGLWEVAYWNVAAANLATGDTNPEWLDTQAQLAARLGRFPDAVAAGEKGLAASANHAIWRAAHAARQEKYRAGQRFGPKD